MRQSPISFLWLWPGHGDERTKGNDVGSFSLVRFGILQEGCLTVCSPMNLLLVTAENATWHNLRRSERSPLSFLWLVQSE